MYLSKKIVEGHGGRIWFEEMDDHDSNNHINNSNSNRDGGIGGMLRHLGDGKKIGATFKFSIPVSLPHPLHKQNACQKKTMHNNNDGLTTTLTVLQQEAKPKKK